MTRIFGGLVTTDAGLQPTLLAQIRLTSPGLSSSVNAHHRSMNFASHLHLNNQLCQCLKYSSSSHSSSRSSNMSSSSSNRCKSLRLVGSMNQGFTEYVISTTVEMFFMLHQTNQVMINRFPCILSTCYINFLYREQSTNGPVSCLNCP